MRKNFLIIGKKLGVHFYSADFNCTVKDTAYVNSILDASSGRIT